MSEFLVIRTQDPEGMLRTLNNFPGVTVAEVPDSWGPVSMTIRVQVWGDVDFLRFALTSQGYGEVVE